MSIDRTTEEGRQRQREYSRRCYRKYREKNIQRAIKWNKRNPDKRRKNHEAWRRRNPEKALACAHAAKRRRKENHPEAFREANRVNMERRRARDPDGEREKHRLWRAANRGPLNARLARHRAKRLSAMPQWLTRAHLAEIRAIYVEGKRLGYHVDHIVPLNGRNVSCLHVPWNLQLLPPSVNRKKYNKLDDQRSADERPAVQTSNGGAA